MVFVCRKDVERQERKAKGGDDFEEEAAVITAMDLEDAWKKSAEGTFAFKVKRKVM